MTPWLGRVGSGEAPTTAIVRASRRICSGLLTILTRVPVDDRLMRWRAGAAALAEAVAADWGLTLQEAYVPGAVGHVVRVDTAEGEPAVLKVFFPDRETELEPDALERWD